MRKRLVPALLLAALLLTGCGAAPTRPTETEPAPAQETKSPAKDTAPAETEAPERADAPAEEDGEEPTAAPEPEKIRVLSGAEVRAELAEYGVSPDAGDWSAAGEKQRSLYALLDPYRSVEYTPPAGDSWPQDVSVRIDAPDLEALLQEAPESEEELLALLTAEDCPRRERTLTVSFPSADFDLTDSTDFEVLDALYGGALSVWRRNLVEKYQRLYEAAKEADQG